MFAQNWLWTKAAVGSNVDEGKAVSTDPSGNIYVTGLFYGPSITFGSYSLANVGGQDIYVVKYDASGNVLWAKSAGGSKDDAGNSISTDAFGNAGRKTSIS